MKRAVFAIVAMWVSVGASAASAQTSSESPLGAYNVRYGAALADSPLAEGSFERNLIIGAPGYQGAGGVFGMKGRSNGGVSSGIRGQLVGRAPGERFGAKLAMGSDLGLILAPGARRSDGRWGRLQLINSQVLFLEGGADLVWPGAASEDEAMAVNMAADQGWAIISQPGASEVLWYWGRGADASAPLEATAREGCPGGPALSCGLAVAAQNGRVALVGIDTQGGLFVDLITLVEAADPAMPGTRRFEQRVALGMATGMPSGVIDLEETRLAFTERVADGSANIVWLITSLSGTPSVVSLTSPSSEDAEFGVAVAFEEGTGPTSFPSLLIAANGPSNPRLYLTEQGGAGWGVFGMHELVGGVSVGGLAFLAEDWQIGMPEQERGESLRGGIVVQSRSLSVTNPFSIDVSTTRTSQTFAGAGGGGGVAMGSGMGWFDGRFLLGIPDLQEPLFGDTLPILEGVRDEGASAFTWSPSATYTAPFGGRYGAAIATRGDVLAISAPAEAIGGMPRGAVYLYRAGEGQIARITAPVSVLSGYGSLIAMGADTLAVISPDATSTPGQGALTLTDISTPDSPGASTTFTFDGLGAIEGTLDVFGDVLALARPMSEEVIIFTRELGEWQQARTLSAPRSGRCFGQTVAVAQGVVIVPECDDDAALPIEVQGKTYVYDALTGDLLREWEVSGELVKMSEDHATLMVFPGARAYQIGGTTPEQWPNAQVRLAGVQSGELPDRLALAPDGTLLRRAAGREALVVAPITPAPPLSYTPTDGRPSAGITTNSDTASLICFTLPGLECGVVLAQGSERTLLGSTIADAQGRAEVTFDVRPESGVEILVAQGMIGELAVRSELIFSVLIDEAAPAIVSVDAPAANSTTGQLPRIRATVMDEVSYGAVMVTATHDGVVVARGEVDIYGGNDTEQVTLHPLRLLPAGEVTLALVATDRAGNASAPVNHTLTVVSGGEVIDLDTVADGFETETTSPIFTGEAPEGSRVIVTVDDREPIETTANADGRWYVQVEDLPPGDHTITVRIITPDGTELPPRTISFSIRAGARAPISSSRCACRAVDTRSGPVAPWWLALVVAGLGWRGVGGGRSRARR